MKTLNVRFFCCGIFALALAASASAAGKTIRNAWPAETLTGTIMMLDPNTNLVVVQGPDKVPFDMRVTDSTRILSGDKRLTLPDLSTDKNHPVSVTFVPTGDGDIARSIHLIS